MTRICFVNAQLPPDQSGGAENYVLRVADALDERGHEVRILTSQPYDNRDSLQPTSETVEDVEVDRFYPLNISHRSGGTPLGMAGKAAWHLVDVVNPYSSRVGDSYLEEFDPDVVHTNNLMGISPRLGRVAQQQGRYHVHTLHDYGLVCPKSTLLREWTADEEFSVCEDPPIPCRAYARGKRKGIGNPDVVTGPSQHVIDVHRDHGFFQGVKTACVPLGVRDVAASPPGPEVNPAVLYVGQQTEPKGLETLFEAARRLEDVTVHVCGTGPYEAETEDAAATIPNLTYHGYVSDERLAELRRSVTAAVVPSLWMENSPLTIYESFAAGLPVVGSNIGGIPELVADGRRGRLVEPGDVVALAGAIRSLVQMPTNALTDLQQNCLAWAQDHTLEKHVDKLEETIYDVADV
jgi:glycosyltransferase involved in cell wall biosynthesis